MCLLSTVLYYKAVKKISTATVKFEGVAYVYVMA